VRIIFLHRFVVAPGCGIRYMNNLGLFLFKDIISFGVAFYLISYYRRKAILIDKLGFLELTTLPPFAKCAKDGAPDHLRLLKGGPPALSSSRNGPRTLIICVD
jgi:hypothetical protein